MKTNQNPLLTEEHPHFGVAGTKEDSPSEPPQKSVNIILILKYIQKYLIKKLKENDLGVENLLMNMHKVHKHIDDFIEMLKLENGVIAKMRAPLVEKKSWMKIAEEKGYILGKLVDDTNLPYIEIGDEKHKFVEVIRDNVFRKKMNFEELKKSLVYFNTDFAGIEHLVALDLSKDIKITKTNPIVSIRDSVVDFSSSNKDEYVPGLYYDNDKGVYRIELFDVKNIHNFRILMIR